MKTLLTCVALLAAIALGGHAAAAELKFAVFAPPNGLVATEIAKPWIDWAYKQSDGALEVKLYAGGTLGRNPAQQLKIVQDGVADVAWIVPTYTPSRFPTLGLFELPGLVKNATEGSAAAFDLHRQGKLPGFEDVKLVGIFTTDTYDLHLAKPIRSLDDLKGQKIRSAGAVQNEIIGALGGVPVGMPVTQIVESISRNVVSGAILNWTSVDSFKVEEAAFFHWNLALGVTPLAFVMNRSVYDQLSPKAKAVIDGSPRMLAKLGGEAFDRGRTNQLAKYARDTRHSIADPSSADQKTLESRFDKIIAKVAENQSAALEALRGALESVR